MNDSLLASQRLSSEGLFQRYSPPEKGFDELFAPGRALRPHWRKFLLSVNSLGEAEFARRWDQAQRLLHEHGIAFSAHGDPHDRPRPWQLDPLPLLIPAAEWQAVSAALQQRAHLLNLILADLYGPQDLLKRGLVPAEIVYRHPGFLRPCHGQRVPDGCFLNFYAADLARSPGGQWWVLGDRTEAPSGAGYALENRIVVSRMLPEIFRGSRVERLAPYFVALRETMHRLARTHRDNPRIALLSQGPRSPNYFENAYLTRYLGYTLVEADDLAVRNNRVTLKTLGGLLPVDVILRQPNSETCDPLELTSTSDTGVPGLLHAARNDNVAVANVLGSGLVESPVFLPLLPKLCQALLGEELKLPGVATWWCGEPEGLAYVLGHLDDLILKRAYRRRGQELQVSQRLMEMSRAERIEAIQGNPAGYVAQETVARSSMPVWRDGELHSSQIALRTFLVGSGSSYTVMQGGLARVSRASDPLEISILAGEGSKDAWVLSDGPVSPVTLLDQPGAPVELRRSGAELPSRVADNFYWLGRHMERADAAARLLRALALRLTGEIDPVAITELPNLLRVLAEQGQIEPGFVVDEMRDQLPGIEQVLPQAVFDEQQIGSLRSILSRLFQVASIVRDRMSIDTWRIIWRIDEQFRPPSYGSLQSSDMLPLVGELITDFAALSGMVMESMTRTQSWRFLDLGRRLERALQTISLVRHALAYGTPVPGPLLEAVVEVADSLMTYRSRYLANLQLAAVLDLLLTDETNPRSVAYQLAALVEHVHALPRDRSQPLYAPEQRMAMAALHTVRMADVQALAEPPGPGETSQLQQLLGGLEAQLPQLSDAISHRYLIHVGPAHQLDEIRPE